tara:strand:- start:358 stop:2028 length:1671 start_codon:yes stop_codon:yes gene_type:complete
MANGAPTVSNGLIVSGVTTVTTLDLNGDLDVDGHLNADNVSIAGVVTATTFVGAVTGNATGLSGTPNISAGTISGSTGTFSGTIETTGNELKITGAEPRLTFTDTDNNPDFQIWANAQKFSIYDSTNSATRFNIDSSGKISIASAAYGGGGTTPELYLRGTSGRQMKIHNSNAGTSSLQITNASTGEGEDAGTQLFTQGTTGDFHIQNAFATGDIAFGTKPSGGSTTERLRISSDGSIVHSSTTSFQIAKGTTAQRPSGVDGMIRFNTSLSQTEEYRDSGWFAISNKSTVSGGTVTTSGGYTIHTFTSSGTLTVAGQAKNGVDYLLVAGGGGGGDTRAGGGGAGGMTATTGASIPVGTYTITVGAGGAGGTSSSDGTDGGSSSFGSISSVVGGGGGGGQQRVGRSGGSGGGGSDSRAGGAGTSGQGNNGGGSSGSSGGGGGGGKGSVGNNGDTDSSNNFVDNNSGGNGGNGASNSYSGSNVSYAGGGGGGSRDDGPYGAGVHGGGNGGRNNSNVAQSGTTNLGGGGGGGARLHGSAGSTYNGAAGGSGIVIIRYLT